MTLNLLNIYNSVASQAWSMFDDEVLDKDEFENVLISSINKALSDLWCSTDFNFRIQCEELILLNDEYEYNLPDGNLVPNNSNGKKGFNVFLNGKCLEYIDNPINLYSKKGTPTAFYLNKDKICFYPTPDKNYDVNIEYFALTVGFDIKGNPIYALNNPDDYIDIPQKLEELFKNALITKVMLYSIANQHDENYSNYKKQFEHAYKLLLKYSQGKNPERKIIY